MSAMEKTVRRLVDLIARGDYDEAVAAGDGKGLNAGDLREEVEEYGFELTTPGSGWWDTVEVTPIDGSDPPQFHVAAPLWESEGRSELTLELELTEVSADEYEAQRTGSTCSDDTVEYFLPTMTTSRSEAHDGAARSRLKGSDHQRVEIAGARR